MIATHSELIECFSAAEGLSIVRKGEERYSTRFCGECYRGYPCFEYSLPDAYDDDCVSEICALQILACKGGINVSADGHGVLSLCPPGSKISTFRYVMKGGFRMGMKYGFGILTRLSSYEKYCVDMMNRYIDENTWYVSNLAVEPAYQGKGLARKMLDPFLGYLDRIGASAYLETHDAANVPFYEHFGFELAEVGCLPGTDIKHYGMIRRAQLKPGERCHWQS